MWGDRKGLMWVFWPIAGVFEDGKGSVKEPRCALLVPVRVGWYISQSLCDFAEMCLEGGVTAGVGVGGKRKIQWILGRRIWHMVWAGGQIQYRRRGG